MNAMKSLMPIAVALLVSVSATAVVGGSRPYVKIGRSATSSVRKSGCEAPAGEKKVIKVKGVSFTMIPVEGGTFRMGATREQRKGFSPGSDEYPVHTVTVSPFYIGETEVTQELWRAVMRKKPTRDGAQWEREYGVGKEYPAYYISYNDCLEFIERLNELTGMTFRMPTEAEWEYAARGGKMSEVTPFSGSNDIEDVAWYYSNSDSQTHPVKTKNPNELGIYDMSGNVWEWCSDWYGKYERSAVTDPVGPPSGPTRILRGGSMLNDAPFCRASHRNITSQDGRGVNYGLRLVIAE